MLVPALVPFALVWGALATDAGWHPGTSMLAAATIFAGASQYLMLELIGQGVSAFGVLLAVFAVNFRHVLYSAALARRLDRFGARQRAAAFFVLVDPAFASAERRARLHGALEPAWYFGYALSLYAVWLLSVGTGVAAGAVLSEPERFGLDFILPLWFLAILAGFRREPGFAPVLIASVCGSLAAHSFIGAPWHIALGAVSGLVVALARPIPRPAQEARA